MFMETRKSVGNTEIIYTNYPEVPLVEEPVDRLFTPM
jgi:hypothetical protein